MGIVIAVAVVLWGLSFFRFRQQYSRDRVLCELLKRKYELMPNTLTECEYACGLMLCQQYRSALELFEELKHSGADRRLSYLDMNIAFCNKPLPWSTGAKNHNGSWLHHFLLVRIGRRRRVAISADSYLEANAVLRARGRSR